MSVTFMHSGLRISCLPFLMLRYHVGPLSLTNELVIHSRSERGILHTFSVISAARVGRGCISFRNSGRKGRISLRWRLLPSLPISRTCMLGVGPPPTPSRTMIPAVRYPSYIAVSASTDFFFSALLTLRYTINRFGEKRRFPIGDETKPT